MFRILFLTVLSEILISCKQNKTTIHPQKRDIIQVVYASGKIYPLNVYNVYSKLPGYVSKLYVKAGDFVKAGQPLLSIQSEITEKNLEMVRNHLKLASENYSKNSPK